jgi:hypothetical protein
MRAMDYYIWRYKRQHKDLRGRFLETYELTHASLPRCDICGKEYVPIPDPVKPLPFSVEPEELGWEWEIVESKKVRHYHIKCDIETLEDPAVRAKYVKLAKDVLRKMGFNPAEVVWLK